jgi:hypothetical protein
MFKLIRTHLSAIAIATLAFPTVAFAQGCIQRIDDATGVYRDGSNATQVRFTTTYFSQISERDTYNSKGVKLSGYRQILQQDRANVNRFGLRDFVTMSDGDTDANGNLIEWKMWDATDDFFTTPQLRALFTTMPLIFNCNDQGRPNDHENSTDFLFWTRAMSIGQVPGTLMLMVIPLPQGGYGFHFEFVG